MTARPRISFGMIVLNGEPFLRYNLRALYPFAHQIIVVEGAAPAAASVASPRGHSLDGTLETLWDFKEREDCEGKLTIVTAEEEGYPDGFWPGEKDEQSQAYARRATGDYLWQVDADEFYRSEDMKQVLDLLASQPEISGVGFPQLQFWGGFSCTVDGWFQRRHLPEIRRLFRWGPGYRYHCHRPPTVLTAEGKDTAELNWLDGRKMKRLGIYLYHYSCVFPRQVLEKSSYYGGVSWAEFRDLQDWFHHVYIRLIYPYRVHLVPGYPSWLEEFYGRHPAQIEELRRDLEEGRWPIALRPGRDLERLLRSPRYRFGRAFLKLVEPVARGWVVRWRRFRWFLGRARDFCRNLLSGRKGFEGEKV